MAEMGVRQGRKFREGGDICVHMVDSGLPRWLSSKESTCQLKETEEMWVQSLGWEDPLEEEMAVHSSVLAGRICGQRSMAGYRPWGCKELDMTEN